MSEDLAPYETSRYAKPGPRPVSQHDVDRAADDLLFAGDRPSIEKVRAKIGGSPDTMAPLLDDWWRRLGERVRTGPSAFERLPQAAALGVEAVFLTLLDEACERARKEEGRGRAQLEADKYNQDVRAHVLSLREQEFQQRIAE